MCLKPLCSPRPDALLSENMVAVVVEEKEEEVAVAVEEEEEPVLQQVVLWLCVSVTSG